MTGRIDSQWSPFTWTLALLTWTGFALTAVVGGIIRVTLLEPRLGERLANVTETLGLVILLAGIIWLAIPWLLPGLRPQDLKRVGIFWMVLTLAFEFLFGHFIDGADWSALVANYDVMAGRLWILVPLTMGVGPLLVGRLKAPAPGRPIPNSPPPRGAPPTSSPASIRHP